jgi:uncharacterized protein (DUF885 family)
MRGGKAACILAVIVLTSFVTVVPAWPDAALDTLRGLPIRRFFDASYRLILLRDPEMVPSMGLAEEFGVQNDLLTPVSRGYVAETYCLYRGILALLRTYDRSALDEQDRLSYDVNVEDGVGDLAGLPAVAYHEAVPGHYFQAAVAAGLDLPLFRRVEASNAYLEGWALYAEQLGLELGLYATTAEKVVQLDLRLTRACRVVVDAGIHDQGWSLQEAAAFFEAERGSPPGQEDAMARYMDLPGQGGKLHDRLPQDFRASGEGRAAAYGYDSAYNRTETRQWRS